MSHEKGLYKEKVERYCHVLNKNVKFDQFQNGNERCFECSHREECKKNGGCSHHIFKQFNS